MQHNLSKGVSTTVPVEQEAQQKPLDSQDESERGESKTETQTTRLSSREEDGLKVSQFWFRTHGIDDDSIEKGLLLIIASYYGKFPV